MPIEHERIQFDFSFWIQMLFVETEYVEIHSIGYRLLESSNDILVDDESHGVIEIEIMFFVLQFLVEESQSSSAVRKGRRANEVGPKLFTDQCLILPSE